ncbi:MAG: SDR family oxidoreductase [Candidatus Hydrogenedentes bacterium]|nr:SDR family oxidoreductase [Candidatus Hydrogenedentota bacterium]
MRIDLEGKVAVVTGATGQLGRVMIRTLAECGADVVIHYARNKAKAEELAAEVIKIGGRALTARADVTDFASVQRMARRVTREWADADIIVNNAVIQYNWTTILEQKVSDYESQFRSCVLHNLHMAKCFLPGMIRKGAGRVIGINTECTLQCWPSQSAYVSGKHGMNGLLQVMAKEVGAHGITVNQVAPGWMLSDRDRALEAAGKTPQDAERKYAAMLPLKHRGEDQDIANVVAFLASDLAKFITGAFIPVNGGGATLPAWA